MAEGASGTDPGLSGRRLKELATTHGALLAATGAAILCRGYYFGKEDQALYLPFVLKWNDPTLFPHDPLLQQGFAKLSGTWAGVSLLARVLDLQTLCLLLYILASYLVLWLTYTTALAWWEDRPSAWLAVVLWIPTFHVPGVANDTFDDYFTHRLVGTIFGMAVIGAVLQHRRWRGGIYAFLGGIGHLVSVVPAVGGGVLAALSRRRWKSAAWLAGGLALAVLPLLVLKGGVSSEWRYTGQWRDLVVLADSELFPHLWLNGAWPGLAVYVAAFFGLYVWRKRHGMARSTEDDVFWVGVGIILAAAAGWLASALFWIPLIQLCLFRGFLFLMWLVALYLAGTLAPLLQDVRWPVVVAAAWVAGSWLSGHFSLAVLGVPVLVAAGGWHRLNAWAAHHWAGKRGVIVLVLGVVMIFWGGDLLFYLFGFNAEEWFHQKGAELFALAFVLFFALLRLIRLKGSRVPFALVLSAAFAMAVVLVPPQALVAWIRLPANAEIRAFYGPRIGTGVAKGVARRREAAQRLTMAALVRERVPKDSAVLIPPDWMEFRADALRSPYVTFKDGAPSEFERAYAEGWFHRLLAAHAVNRAGGRLVLDPAAELTDEEMLDLSQKEAASHLDYAITRRECGFPLLGRAGDLRLYQIQSTPPSAASAHEKGAAP